MNNKREWSSGKRKGNNWSNNRNRNENCGKRKGNNWNNNRNRNKNYVKRSSRNWSNNRNRNENCGNSSNNNWSNNRNRNENCGNKNSNRRNNDTVYVNFKVKFKNVAKHCAQRTAQGQGIAMGLNNSFMSLGRSVGPLWAGIVYDINTSFPYISGAIILLVGFFVTFFKMGAPAASRAIDESKDASYTQVS